MIVSVCLPRFGFSCISFTFFFFKILSVIRCSFMFWLLWAVSQRRSHTFWCFALAVPSVTNTVPFYSGLFGKHRL